MVIRKSRKKHFDLDGEKIINLNMGTTESPANDDNFTIHFKGEPKESKKKQIQDQKFRAINDFIPKTNVFSKLK